MFFPLYHKSQTQRNCKINKKNTTKKLYQFPSCICFRKLGYARPSDSSVLLNRKYLNACIGS